MAIVQVAGLSAPSIRVNIMDATISIPKQAAGKLRRRARANGQPLPVYASKIVKQTI